MPDIRFAHAGTWPGCPHGRQQPYGCEAGLALSLVRSRKYSDLSIQCQYGVYMFAQLYIYIIYVYNCIYIYISLLYSKHKSIGCTAVNWGEISQRGPAEVHQTGRQRSPGGFDNGSFSLFTLNIGRHIWLPIWLRNSTYLYDYIYDYRILQIWLDMTTVDMTRYGYRRWLDISRYD